MAAFQKLAEHLVAEMPVTKLQEVLASQSRIHPDTGMVCGGGCGPTGGSNTGGLCGLSCKPQVRAQYVIDPTGHLGLTTKDITEIHNNLPKLRQAVVQQVEAHLSQLR